MNLIKKDYIDILDYYKINYNKNLPINLLQKLCYEVIAKKLCICIKKVRKNSDENKAIGICSKSILNNRNMHIYKFTCKKKPKLKLKKSLKANSQKIYKTGKIVFK